MSDAEASDNELSFADRIKMLAKHKPAANTATKTKKAQIEKPKADGEVKKKNKNA
jgi:hypothetical protein